LVDWKGIAQLPLRTVWRVATGAIGAWIILMVFSSLFAVPTLFLGKDVDFKWLLSLPAWIQLPAWVALALWLARGGAAEIADEVKGFVRDAQTLTRREIRLTLLFMVLLGLSADYLPSLVTVGIVWGVGIAAVAFNDLNSRARSLRESAGAPESE
jgi:hypothetical protein